MSAILEAERRLGQISERLPEQQQISELRMVVMLLLSEVKGLVIKANNR